MIDNVKKMTFKSGCLTAFGIFILVWIVSLIFSPPKEPHFPSHGEEIENQAKEEIKKENKASLDEYNRLGNEGQKYLDRYNIELEKAELTSDPEKKAEYEENARRNYKAFEGTERLQTEIQNS
jgi:hypothetical protein